jgi:hypothetical protein
MDSAARCTAASDSGIHLQCTFLEQFDTNGDGNVNLDQFRAMIRTAREVGVVCSLHAATLDGELRVTSVLDSPLITPCHRPQATSLFTGSEELAHLSNAQMNALLLYDDWPEKHIGPGDVEEGEGLGGLFKLVSKEHVKSEEAVKDEEETEEHADRRRALEPGGTRDEYKGLVELDEVIREIQEMKKAGELWWYPEWESDKTQAEHIFLESPDELPAWLDRMRVKKRSESEKRIEVVDLAEELVKDAVIAVPPQTWKIEFADVVMNQDTSKEPTQEELLFFRLGFIFMAYRVDFWFWESIEV